MKIQNRNQVRQGGFTAAEMVVSTMIMAILGIVFLNVLNSGMILYAKNTAVNAAHEEGREGVNRLVRDIHAAVSVPQLRNSTTDANNTVAGSFTVASSAPVNGVAPTAAGVSFQDVVQEVSNANAAANHSNVFLANGADTTIANKARKYGQSSYSGWLSPYAVTYYTERMLYVVEGGTYIADSQGPWVLSSGQYVAYTSGTMQRYRFENGVLNLYKQRNSNPGNSGYFYWSKIATVARYISSPQPFYIPLNTSGTQDTKYVGIKLSARDPSTSNRNYLSTASLLDTQIDYRSRICLYQ